MKNKKKLSLTVQIVIGLALGVMVGLALQNYADFAKEYIKPFGTIYLNLIKMVVVPVVLLSIMQGIVSLQDVRKVDMTIKGFDLADKYLMTSMILADGTIREVCTEHFDELIRGEGKKQIALYKSAKRKSALGAYLFGAKLEFRLKLSRLKRKLRGR